VVNRLQSTDLGRAPLRDFFAKAGIQKGQGTLCDRRLYMVKDTMIKWLCEAPGEVDDVKKCFDGFGGEPALGLSFQTIKEMAGIPTGDSSRDSRFSWSFFWSRTTG
jgi:hypothetical protein